MNLKASNLVTDPLPKPSPAPGFTDLQQLTSPFWLGWLTSFEKNEKNKWKLKTNPTKPVT